MVAIPKKVADRLPDVDPDDRPDYDAMPEAHYLAKVIGNEIEEAGPNGKTGENMLALTMEMIQPREFAGRKVWDRISFSEKADWKMRSFFDAADYDFDSDVDEIQDDETEFVIYLTTEVQKQEKNKGKPKNNVGEYLPADEENLDLVED